jgi:hypothetical protein
MTGDPVASKKQYISSSPCDTEEKAAERKRKCLAPINSVKGDL